MQCEMCGTDTKVSPVVVEGTLMRVCDNCAKFGRRVQGEAAKRPGMAANVAEGLARRERRMGGTKDVFAAESMAQELVEDFGARIRRAREAKGWERQQLGSRIKEPENAVAQFEAGTLHPTDETARRLEKQLGVTLLTKVPTVAGRSAPAPSSGFTLGDMIKKTKQKK